MLEGFQYVTFSIVRESLRCVELQLRTVYDSTEYQKGLLFFESIQIWQQKFRRMVPIWEHGNMDGKIT